MSNEAAGAVISRMAWLFGGPLLAPMRQFAGAMVISVGPWIVSVAALAILSFTMTPLMGGSAIEDLRLSVVYAFAVAPLIAGPIGTIAARLILNSIQERGGRFVFEIFRVAALGSGVLAMGAATTTALLLGLDPVSVAIGFVWMTIAAALLWTTFAVLAALGLYRLLITSFSTGMLLSVFCSLAAARAGPTIELLVWSFTAGIVFCVILAFAHVSARYSCEDDNPATAFWLVVGEIGRVWPLALGVAAIVAAVWVDKAVFWFGPIGMRSAAGFLHYGPYDSVMFVAHLSIIPSLAAILLFQDGALRECIEAFRATLTHRSTYEEVQAATLSIGRTVWTHVFTIVFIQASCSAAVILMAPIVTELMDFDLIQFDLLRIGIVAILLQSLLFVSSSVLIVCQCVRTFCLIQLAFLALNFIASGTLQWWLGVNSYAVLVSSMAAAVASSLFAYRALSDYDYLVFVGENDGLYRKLEDATATRMGPLGSVQARIAAARSEWTSLAHLGT